MADKIDDKLADKVGDRKWQNDGRTLADRKRLKKKLLVATRNQNGRKKTFEKAVNRTRAAKWPTEYGLREPRGGRGRQKVYDKKRPT